MFQVKDFIKPQKKHFIWAQITIAFETIIDLQLPLIIAALMDNGVMQGDMSVIAKYAFVYIILLTLNGLATFLFGYSSAHASNGMAADMRLKTFLHINRLKLAETHSMTAGSLITRLTSDIDIIQQSTNLFLRLGVRAPLQLIGGIVMLLLLDIRFSLILFIALIVLIIIVILVMTHAQPMYKKIQKGLDELNIVNQESIVGFRTIKSYCGEEVEKARFSEKNQYVSQIVFELQRLMSVMQPSFSIVMNLALAALLMIGSTAIQSHDMQIGQIMAAVSYLTQILFGLMMLVMIFPPLSRAIISLQRIKEVFALEVEKEINVEHTEKLTEIQSLEFSNISFAYQQVINEENNDNNAHRDCLKNINFSIKNGERVGFLGTTGAGKSTIIKLLFGLYEPTEGKIYINGKEIGLYAIKDIRQSISYVLQRSDLFNASIYENITFGDENYTQDHAQNAAKIAHADDFIMDFEENYLRELGSKGVGVSGGQKQRINLSRAFLKKSGLLILDDCTSALDLRTERKVHKAIRQTDMYKSIILISQKVVSVMDMDKIYVLDKGRIEAVGNHKELIQNSPLYREFCKSQNIDTEEGHYE